MSGEGLGLALVVGLLICGVIGGMVGNMRGRVGAGVGLGVFLGPFGVIAAAMLPWAPEAGARQRMQVRDAMRVLREGEGPISREAWQELLESRWRERQQEAARRAEEKREFTKWREQETAPQREAVAISNPAARQA